MTILDLISQVHLPSSVNMLPKYLKRFTFSSLFWCIVIVTGGGCLEILITFVFFHIHFHAIDKETSDEFKNFIMNVFALQGLEG